MQEAKSPIKYSSAYLNKSINQKKRKLTERPVNFCTPEAPSFSLPLCLELWQSLHSCQVEEENNYSLPHLPFTSMEELRSFSSKGSEKIEWSRTQNSLPPLSSRGASKQPCCRELVPVWGQDRAHRLHSGAAPRFSPPSPLPVTRTSEQEKPTLLIMDFTTWWFLLRSAGDWNISRCTDRTNWYIATLQCSTGERPYSNHATQGRAPVISVDFELCVLLSGSHRHCGRWGIS